MMAPHYYNALEKEDMKKLIDKTLRQIHKAKKLIKEVEK